MYKLMYRVRHADVDNVFAFWGAKMEDGTVVEYVYETEEAVKQAGRQLAKKVGTDDIRVIQDEDYYLQLIYGLKPTPEPQTYSVIFSGLEHSEEITDIVAGANVSTEYVKGLDDYHFVINGEEVLGLPEWMDLQDGILTLNCINQNYDIQIILHY